jgi:putative restriction endonuclease
LRHEQLLDAAHIIPDKEPEGRATVPNGLALCKFHHAAFDRQFLAVRPDYVVEIRRDIMEEKDGPMLLHGLKGMHEKQILLPRNRAERPDTDLLNRRYEQFLEVARRLA